MTETQQAEEAAERIAASFADVWNRHDARAFAAMFAEDADFTNVFGMRAKGRDAIERFHRPMFETMFKDSRVTIDETRTRVIRSDVVAADLYWTMEGARDPSGAEWPSRRGLANMIFTRKGADWSIAVMHNMDLSQPHVAEALARLQEAPQT